MQAANGTNSQSDRAALQAEVAQSVAEVDRIGTTTSFNGQKLFAESDSSVMGDPNKLAVLDGLKSGWLQNSEELISQYFGIVGDGAGISIELSSFSDGAGGTAAQVVGSVGATGKATNVKLQVDMADFVPPNPPNGGTAPFYNDRIILHEMVHAVMYRSTNYGSLADVANDQKWFTEGVSEFIHGADERLAASIVAGGGTGTVMARAERFGSAAIDITNGTWGDGGTGQSISDDYSAGYAAVRYLHQKIKDAGGAGVKDVLTYMTQNLSVTLNTALANATHGAFTGEADFLTSFNTNGAAFIGAMNLSDTDTGAVGGANADGGSIKTAENVILDSGTYGDNALQYFAETWEIVPSSVVTTTKTLQIGANVGETLDIVSGAMNSGALDISTISLETDPSNAILRIDRALDYVNGERAKLGAQLNRLDSTLANLQTGVETTSASRSRTQDTDFAVRRQIWYVPRFSSRPPYR